MKARQQQFSSSCCMPSRAYIDVDRRRSGVCLADLSGIRRSKRLTMGITESTSERSLGGRAVPEQCTGYLCQVLRDHQHSYTSSCLSVCPSVCLSTSLSLKQNGRPNFSECSVHVAVLSDDNDRSPARRRSAANPPLLTDGTDSST